MHERALPKTVYVVDDDTPVRLSLCALLEAHGFKTADFPTAEAFLAGLDASAALCAFVDLRMPGMSGIDLQKQLSASGVTIPIIILTAHGDVPLAVEAMKAGAFDFIEKPGSVEQLLGMIEAAECRRADRPGAGISPSVVSERIARLTVREREVLEHLVLGMTNKHIADELGISQRTVEIHRSRIREKMEARGLSDLIRMMR